MTTIITETDALAEVCERFRQSPYITIDTEFVRETTFWPDLCLVQIAMDDDAVLIDPLAKGIDLAPLIALLEDQTVIKVFHSARQDLEIFYKLMGSVPMPLFDTQVAAMVCGFGDQIAYDQLVKRLTGAHIDKTSRFTDWKRRPLTEKQTDYALADVTHLRDVYRLLSEQLEETGRAGWVTEEMSLLENPETYDMPPENAWQRMKMRVRKPLDFQIMRDLAQWREETARERNVPRNRVMKDDAIYEIAQQQPITVQALSRLRAVPRGLEKSSKASAIIRIVEAAKELDPDDLMRVPRPPASQEGTGAAVDLLRIYLKIVSEREGVAAKVLATTADLEALANLGEDADIAALSGWRRELFGESALQLVAGKLAIRFSDRALTVEPV
ncbi:MAG: ribonuclease D [Pseudomonadota bacterium]